MSPLSKLTDWVYVLERGLVSHFPALGSQQLSTLRSLPIYPGTLLSSILSSAKFHKYFALIVIPPDILLQVKFQFVGWETGKIYFS